MADFCLECTLDVFPELAGTGLNDLTGLCEPGHKAWAVCEGCGAGWFDHAGKRVAALKVPAAPPGNIYSGERSARTVLTNPTELARRKGNLRQSYPVDIEGVVYADAEEAYQRLKRKLGHFAGMAEREALCARVVEAKLWQHPRIALCIAHNGGVQWLAQCRHFTGTRTHAFSEWEGQGYGSAFIRALIKAWRAVNSTRATIRRCSTPSRYHLPGGSQPQVDQAARDAREGSHLVPRHDLAQAGRDLHAVPGQGPASDTCAARMRSVVIGRVAASATIGQDGKPHASLEVTAESVRFLGGKNGNGATGAAQDESGMDIDESEIPF